MSRILMLTACLGVLLFWVVGCGKKAEETVVPQQPAPAVGTAPAAGAPGAGAPGVGAPAAGAPAAGAPAVSAPAAGAPVAGAPAAAGQTLNLKTAPPSNAAGPDPNSKAKSLAERRKELEAQGKVPLVGDR